MPQIRSVEVFFVIDRSGGMRDDLSALTANLDLLIPEMEKVLGQKGADCRFGVVMHDASLTWPWQDLGSLAQLKAKLAQITCGDSYEATPQAMDYVLEHASWDPARRGFLVVLADEPAETGMGCSLKQFRTVMDKIMAKGLGLLLIGTPGCFKAGDTRLIYDHASVYPRVFVTDRLHDDKGEKLIQWLAVKLIQWLAVGVPEARVGTAQPGQTATKDVFGLFSRVTLT